MKTTKDVYSNSRIMRRCGQLGIDYDEAIGSPYFSQQGLKRPSLLIQYKDGKNGTVGWGSRKEMISLKDTAPHSLLEMHKLLKRN